MNALTVYTLCTLTAKIVINSFSHKLDFIHVNLTVAKSQFQLSLLLLKFSLNPPRYKEWLNAPLSQFFIHSYTLDLSEEGN